MAQESGALRVGLVTLSLTQEAPRRRGGDSEALDGTGPCEYVQPVPSSSVWSPGGHVGLELPAFFKQNSKNSDF